jgi:hypothetical protein
MPDIHRAQTCVQDHTLSSYTRKLHPAGTDLRLNVTAVFHKGRALCAMCNSTYLSQRDGRLYTCLLQAGPAINSSGIDCRPYFIEGSCTSDEVARQKEVIFL